MPFTRIPIFGSGTPVALQCTVISLFCSSEQYSVDEFQLGSTMSLVPLLMFRKDSSVKNG